MFLYLTNALFVPENTMSMWWKGIKNKMGSGSSTQQEVKQRPQSSPNVIKVNGTASPASRPAPVSALLVLYLYQSQSKYMFNLVW